MFEFNSDATFCRVKIRKILMLRKFIPLCLMLALPGAFAAELPGTPEFIDEMVSKHQFKHDELAQVFQEA